VLLCDDKYEVLKEVAPTTIEDKNAKKDAAEGVAEGVKEGDAEGVAEGGEAPAGE